MSEKIYKKLTSLFDILPFDEKGIKIFTDSFKSSNKDDRLNLTIENYLFLRQNKDKKTFIETIVAMDYPKSVEEMKIRLFLMSTFFGNRNNNSAIMNNHVTIIKEAYTKLVENKYKSMFKKAGINPQFTLDEYCEQIAQVINTKKNKEIINEKISLILDTYFKDMENIFDKEKSIAFVALANKAKNYDLFNSYNSIIASIDFALLYLDKFTYSKDERDFFIKTISGAYILEGNTVNINDNESSITEELMFNVLKDIVSDSIGVEKIMNGIYDLKLDEANQYKSKNKIKP